jgi:hypothetical protein
VVLFLAQLCGLSRVRLLPCKSEASEHFKIAPRIQQHGPSDPRDELMPIPHTGTAGT